MEQRVVGKDRIEAQRTMFRSKRAHTWSVGKGGNRKDALAFLKCLGLWNVHMVGLWRLWNLSDYSVSMLVIHEWGWLPSGKRGPRAVGEAARKWGSDQRNISKSLGSVKPKGFCMSLREGNASVWKQAENELLILHKAWTQCTRRGKKETILILNYQGTNVFFKKKSCEFCIYYVLSTKYTVKNFEWMNESMNEYWMTIGERSLKVWKERIKNFYFVFILVETKTFNVTSKQDRGGWANAEDLESVHSSHQVQTEPKWHGCPQGSWSDHANLGT